MGAGASVAHELSANAAGQLKPNTSIPGHGVGPVESQYNEMVEHLRDVSGAGRCRCWRHLSRCAVESLAR